MKVSPPQHQKFWIAAGITAISSVALYYYLHSSPQAQPLTKKFSDYRFIVLKGNEAKLNAIRLLVQQHLQSGGEGELIEASSVYQEHTSGFTYRSAKSQEILKNPKHLLYNVLGKFKEDEKVEWQGVYLILKDERPEL